MPVDVAQIKDQVAEHADTIRRLKAEVGKVIVGQEEMVSRLLVALLCNGHILLEGVPGLAKTTAIKSLAKCVDTEFRRIQFTPDLLPADLIGTLIYMPNAGQFVTRKGPIFTNFLLADEINRAPSKVQSALLEAMEERQVTIGEETHRLSNLFLVLATQNPIEQEGTYPLPEAQVDRFMLKVRIDYPEPADERMILDRSLDRSAGVIENVARSEHVLAMRDVVGKVYVDEQVRDYVVNLVRATREPAAFRLKEIAPLIEFGASPRATLFLAQGARALAFLRGRGYVTPQDVKDLAPDVLRHRLLLSYEAEAERTTVDDVIETLLAKMPVP